MAENTGWKGEQEVSFDESKIEAFRRSICDAGFWMLDEKIKQNEKMKLHTSFRVGGPARLYVEPADLREVVVLVQKAGEVGLPYFLMGNGSNLVISDAGFDGLVIRLGECFSSIWLEADENGDMVMLHAYAGALLTKVSSFATRNELEGLEFASGIPGSIGGAVFMNAGAYNHEMAEIVESALCVSPEGET